jgi:hypothetical protein
MSHQSGSKTSTYSAVPAVAGWLAGWQAGWLGKCGQSLADPTNDSSPTHLVHDTGQLHHILCGTQRACAAAILQAMPVTFFCQQQDLSHHAQPCDISVTSVCCHDGRHQPPYRPSTLQSPSPLLAPLVQATSCRCCEHQQGWKCSAAACGHPHHQLLPPHHRHQRSLRTSRCGQSCLTRHPHAPPWAAAAE